ncbi:HisA/HisF-related TIM barrel protein [Stieleria sp. ICT_E10.1]|uniref:HisA/HisF-related TIM barrel protein n=1 Tax=Stieleria sedimenti TaxID=2976331 RepID=UPI00217FCD5C|nr:HisA/HisF-related TIM barrel protein [Stieleria sedimenti]MCS7467981.1 HisA/HisF-related TIM barrel protein [Stieleria sedimenti]
MDNALVSRFVGVVDLQAGLAVHGVGGQRDLYRPVSTFQAADMSSLRIDGDVCRLIDGYHGVGIGSLYVADLDGIRCGRWQQSLIEAIVDRAEAADDSDRRGAVFLDLGLRAAVTSQRWNWVESLVRNHPRVVVILATECADDVSLLDDTLSRVPRDQVAVSFDYQGGRWLSASTSETAWLEACRRAAIATVVGLDLASVGGTSIERTLELCKRIRRQLPQPRYVTGGGVRSADDAQCLLDAGADQLLVASLFAE